MTLAKKLYGATAGLALLTLAWGCDSPQDPAVEQMAANLGGTNLGGTNLGGANLGGTNLGGANLGGTNLGGANLGGTNLGGANLGGGLLGVGTGAGLSDLRPGLEPLAPTCRVLGFGALAFGRLLGEQSPLSPLSVELSKLSERFQGSPLHLWQAIVRGDRTSCVFLVPAPADATPAGVSGFVKAVFRWSAPPAQELLITAPGELPPTRHTGMMNAAEHWRAGRVSQQSFLAGALAFTTANTNSRSILVDFASWVADASGAALVLGNVQAENPPSHAESVYYAVENEDGTVAVEVSGAAFAGSGPGVIDGYRELERAWQAYRQGGRARPQPRRCGAALWLQALDRRPAPAGMCDDGLVWSPASDHLDARPWSTVPGTTAPMNEYMLLPRDAEHPLLRARPGSPYRRVLSETYVHMWDANFE